jgi:hypothetical protein
MSEDFQKKYLDHVNNLLASAYKNKGIDTNISSDKIQVSISVPRSKSDHDLVNLLSQIHTVGT